MDLNTAEIRKCIESQLDLGQKNFVLFPYGEVGIKVKAYLNNVYGIKEKLIIDNHLCKYNSEIRSIEALDDLKCEMFCVILCSINKGIYGQLRSSLEKYFDEKQIVELDCMKNIFDTVEKFETVVGKYSYGSLISGYGRLIESIGSFCSFAKGSDVTANHATSYITTHPMICVAGPSQPDLSYDAFKSARWYFAGVQPRGYMDKYSRIKIGNDVWLGHNVTITNGANIGNGVIAGAGAVITKDVPDYAIVAGVPAKIIRFRYSEKQIASLNKIAWWDWTDDEIRERYDDFYLPIEDFIRKYDK